MAEVSNNAVATLAKAFHDQVVDNKFNGVVSHCMLLLQLAQTHYRGSIWINAAQEILFPDGSRILCHWIDSQSSGVKFEAVAAKA